MSSDKTSILDNFDSMITKSSFHLEKIIGSHNLQLISSNKLNVLGILIIIIIFIFITVYTYNHYIKPQFNKNYVANKEFIDKPPNNNVIIYLFYTQWCPYCKTALATWEEFKALITSDARYDCTKSDCSYNIIFQEIDCDIDTNLAKQYKIDSYPTIKILYKNKIYNYEAKPDVTHLQLFLNTTLNSNSTMGLFDTSLDLFNNIIQ